MNMIYFNTLVSVNEYFYKRVLHLVMNMLLLTGVNAYQNRSEIIVQPGKNCWQ